MRENRDTYGLLCTSWVLITMAPRNMWTVSNVTIYTTILTKNCRTGAKLVD